MDSEQFSDQRSAPATVTFDRDRLLDLVSDLERDIALVETAMDDVERDNYDSVDAALTALTPRATPVDAPLAAVSTGPSAGTAIIAAPSTAIMSFTAPGAAPTS